MAGSDQAQTMTLYNRHCVYSNTRETVKCTGAVH